RIVLGRIEHLEQRRRRIALERDAQLVDLVEQEDGVLRARLLHPLDDAPRHRAHVGAPVAADVRLVTGAAERNPHIGPAHRTGDRLRDRRLPDAGWADEQQDRPLLLLVVLVATRPRPRPRPPLFPGPALPPPAPCPSLHHRAPVPLWS